MGIELSRGRHIHAALVRSWEMFSWLGSLSWFSCVVAGESVIQHQIQVRERCLLFWIKLRTTFLAPQPQVGISVTSSWSVVWGAEPSIIQVTVCEAVFRSCMRFHSVDWSELRTDGPSCSSFCFRGTRQWNCTTNWQESWHCSERIHGSGIVGTLQCFGFSPCLVMLHKIF